MLDDIITTRAYLLVRTAMSATDETVVPVCVFASLARAQRALNLVRLYMQEVPPVPGACPPGWMASSDVHGGLTTSYTCYAREASPWVTYEEARQQAPQEWAYWDAQRLAYRLWTEGNPIDPGAPVGTTYDLIPVPFVDITHD